MKIRQKTSRWMTLTALFLVALWLPATSHGWLETAGIIHHDDDGDGDHGMNHEAADGWCKIQSTNVVVKAPALAACAILPILITQSLVVPALEQRSGVLRICGTSPPELSRTWQFTERMALPSRAPSFAA